MVGRLARATIAAGHRPQIQPPNDLHYEPSQVALRQPLVHRRWQQKAGLAVNRAEVAHASDVRASQVLRCHLFYRTIPRRVKSDRLLDRAAEALACEIEISADQFSDRHPKGEAGRDGGAAGGASDQVEVI